MNEVGKVVDKKLSNRKYLLDESCAKYNISRRV